MKNLLVSISFLLLTSAAVLSQASADEARYIVNRPPFSLSREADAAGIDGVIRADIKIDKNGAVKSVDILNDPAWPCDTSPDKEIKQVIRDITENLRATTFRPVYNNKGVPDNAEIVLTFAIGKAFEDLKAKEQPPLLIDGGVVNGKALRLGRPKFPITFDKGYSHNEVQTWVLIDETGKVVKAGAFSGNPRFWQPSRQAACESLFSPTIIDGKPVKVAGRIRYIYESGRKPSEPLP